MEMKTIPFHIGLTIIKKLDTQSFFTLLQTNKWMRQFIHTYRKHLSIPVAGLELTRKGGVITLTIVSSPEGEEWTSDAIDPEYYRVAENLWTTSITVKKSTELKEKLANLTCYKFHYIRLDFPLNLRVAPMLNALEHKLLILSGSSTNCTRQIVNCLHPKEISIQTTTDTSFRQGERILTKIIDTFPKYEYENLDITFATWETAAFYAVRKLSDWTKTFFAGGFIFIVPQDQDEWNTMKDLFIERIQRMTEGSTRNDDFQMVFFARREALVDTALPIISPPPQVEWAISVKDENVFLGVKDTGDRLLVYSTNLQTMPGGGVANCHVHIHLLNSIEHFKKDHRRHFQRTRKWRALLRYVKNFFDTH